MQYAPSRPQFEVLPVSGHLNAAIADELQQQLTAVISASHHTSLLIDMSQVESLDSAGLMALVSALSLSQRLNRQLSLCGIAPAVRIIFELTQLDRVFPIFENQVTFATTLV